MLDVSLGFVLQCIIPIYCLVTSVPQKKVTIGPVCNGNEFCGTLHEPKSEEKIMLIRVMYRDHRYDYVDTNTLGRLIDSEGITRFLRPSEHAWIEIARSPVRGSGGIYTGPERRLSRAS